MISSKKPLDRQTVVITGASSGIGLNTVRMAARRGVRVVLMARKDEVLAAEQFRLKSNGVKAIYVAADVGDRGAVEAVAAPAQVSVDTVTSNSGVSTERPRRSARTTC